MQYKILVVDDEKEIADLVTLYLKSEGFLVFEFYNATDALKCIEKEELDLAVLDVMLQDTVPAKSRQNSMLVNS